MRWLLLVLLPLVGCCPYAAPAHDTATLYRHAMRDAMLAEPHERATDLLALTPEQPSLRWRDGRVLMVTWTAYGDSYVAGDTLTMRWGETWVTAVPELREVFRARRGSAPATLRLEQLLGLPENSGKEWLIELWVEPGDIFRPSADPAIDDRAAELYPAEDLAPEHRRWLERTTFANYCGARKFPWTRLGYTYDWSPDAAGRPVAARGVSEFVVRDGATVIVASKTATADYLTAP